MLIQSDNMKKNTFYLIVGCIALALLVIFWYSVELHIPLFIEIAFVIGIALVYLAKRGVTDVINDERDVKITEQATARTMQVSGSYSVHSRLGPLWKYCIFRSFHASLLQFVHLSFCPHGLWDISSWDFSA
jgi:Ni/Fe-hydrogenase subunit HybB-like protein